jgi:hypothetical protein
MIPLYYYLGFGFSRRDSILQESHEVSGFVVNEGLRSKGGIQDKGILFFFSFFLFFFIQKRVPPNLKC